MVRISEAELARDLHAVLAKVQQGIEVVVEQDHRPVAVIKPSQPAGRMISEIVSNLKARGSAASLMTTSPATSKKGDPKLKRYVVAVSHDPAFRPGDLIE
jgi:antitoxin (DNA-binding transcriptional repressor) of toxin-antitoxin stability system